MERLDQELQQRSSISLTDYEILSALAATPERRLRMSDLAREVLVSRSRLTYRVDRLTEVEFVVREECEDDRRGLWAILTDTGEQALQDASAAHMTDVRNWFFDLMTEEELTVVHSVMTRIDDKLSRNS
ncbi:MAG: MarR family winged helix-turn-helix transcriptional regulator [Acidimicrobiales bacterium]